VSYQLKYTDEAKLALRTAPGFYRQRFKRAIKGLANNPWPDNAEDTREPNRYKIKFGRWRLLYDVNDDSGIVRILRIRLKTGPETYRDLEDL
jgi:mRNA-degrading endonuclease RelE of RelBE toxin-antitoxin system